MTRRSSTRTRIGREMKHCQTTKKQKPNKKKTQKSETKKTEMFQEPRPGPGIAPDHVSRKARFDRRLFQAVDRHCLDTMHLGPQCHITMHVPIMLLSRSLPEVALHERKTWHAHTHTHILHGFAMLKLSSACRSFKRSNDTNASNWPSCVHRSLMFHRRPQIPRAIGTQTTRTDVLSMLFLVLFLIVLFLFLLLLLFCFHLSLSPHLFLCVILLLLHLHILRLIPYVFLVFYYCCFHVYVYFLLWFLFCSYYSHLSIYICINFLRVSSLFASSVLLLIVISLCIYIYPSLLFLLLLLMLLLPVSLYITIFDYSSIISHALLLPWTRRTKRN